MKFHVVEACAYTTSDGKGVTAMPGAVLEADDSEVKHLVADGKLEPVRGSGPAAKIKG